MRDEGQNPKAEGRRQKAEGGRRKAITLVTGDQSYGAF
jgi:hypothetical protein